MGKTRGTQAGPTPQWAPGPARAPLGGPTPPAARLPGPSRVSLELVLELGNTTHPSTEEETSELRLGAAQPHANVTTASAALTVASIEPN